MPRNKNCKAYWHNERRDSSRPYNPSLQPGHANFIAGRDGFINVRTRRYDTPQSPLPNSHSSGFVRQQTPQRRPRPTRRAIPNPPYRDVRDHKYCTVVRELFIQATTLEQSLQDLPDSLNWVLALDENEMDWDVTNSTEYRNSRTSPAPEGIWQATMPHPTSGELPENSVLFPPPSCVTRLAEDPPNSMPFPHHTRSAEDPTRSAPSMEYIKTRTAEDLAPPIPSINHPPQPTAELAPSSPLATFSASAKGLTPLLSTTPTQDFTRAAATPASIPPFAQTPGHASQAESSASLPYVLPQNPTISGGLFGPFHGPEGGDAGAGLGPQGYGDWARGGMEM